jgi:hypothetical protein
LKETTNFKLKKPELIDPADITQLNTNWDILDKEIKGLRQAVEIKSGTLDTYKDVGLYVYSANDSNSIINTPEKVQSTMVVLPRLMADNSANRIQIVLTQTNHLYIRNLAENTWAGWTRLRGSEEVIPVIYGGTGSTDIAGIRNTINLPETCLITEDWNTATNTGWYMSNGANKNAPSTSWVFGFVIAHNDSYVLQEVYDFTKSSTKATDLTKYIRSCYAGTWTNWINVTVQRTVPEAAKLDYIKTLTSDAQTQLNGKMKEKPAFIEFAPNKDSSNGGYFDFHFGGSDKDFTTRIIEDLEGQLRIIANKIVAQGDIEGTFIKLSGNLKVAGGYGVVSADENAATLSSVHDLENDYKRVFQVMSENHNSNIANALNLILKNASGTKNYLVYGQHNKPNGSYTGTWGVGTPNKKYTGTIDIGGNGIALLVYGESNDMALITSRDTYAFGTTGGGYPDYRHTSDIRFINGKLTVDFTTDSGDTTHNTIWGAVLSQSTHYYQVL